MKETLTVRQIVVLSSLCLVFYCLFVVIMLGINWTDNIPLEVRIGCFVIGGAILNGFNILIWHKSLYNKNESKYVR